jgi:hypothetical protein
VAGFSLQDYFCLARYRLPRGFLKCINTETVFPGTNVGDGRIGFLRRQNYEMLTCGVDLSCGYAGNLV